MKAIAASAIAAILANVDAADLLRSPKVLMNPLDAAASEACDFGDLNEARRACVEFVRVVDCQCYNCVEVTRDPLSLILQQNLEDSPVYRGCEGEDVIFATNDLDENDVFSYLRADDNPSGDDLEGEFLGCFNLETFEVVAIPDAVLDSRELGLYFSVKGGESLEYPQRYEINASVDWTPRVRDTTGECYSGWYPFRDLDGPLGDRKERVPADGLRVTASGAAVYCYPDCFSQGQRLTSSARIWYDDSVPIFPVDKFYQRSICVEGSWNPTHVIATDSTCDFCNCDEECADAGYEVAVVSQDQCACAFYEDLPRSGLISKSCLSCADNVPPDLATTNPRHLMCGSDTAYSLYYTSLLPDSVQANYGYKYWHCINRLDELRSRPQDVLPPELFWITEEPYDGTAGECLEQCSSEKLDVAVFETADVESEGEGTPPQYPHKYRCLCLPKAPLYSFNVADFNYECLNHWCPSVKGPCLSAGQNANGPTASYYASAVYVFGDEDDQRELVMSPTSNGVCQEEGVRARPSSISARLKASQFLVCQYDVLTATWSWRLDSCNEDEEFRDDQRECVKITGLACRAVDGRGVEWFAVAGEFAVKDCDEGLPDDANPVTGSEGQHGQISCHDS